MRDAPSCKQPPYRHRLAAVTAVLAVVLATVLATAEGRPPTLVRYQPPSGPGDQRDDYAIALLRLALERTAHDFGPSHLQPIGLRMSQERAVREMARGRYVDVVWMMTSPARERALQPVRIPLARGLLGVRVPVTRRGDAERFDGIRDVAGLARLEAGQGHDWPDTRILRGNGLPVTAVSDYDSLFRMLARGRFDYFPRGIQEIGAERPRYQAHGLAAYPDLLLVYPAPNYFFVAPGNHRLGLRLRVGLERALADGSLERLMGRHPATAAAIARLRNRDQRVVRLRNPILPDPTPLDRGELWLSPLFDPDTVRDNPRQP